MRNVFAPTQSILALLLATTLTTATRAETITLTVSAESFVADTGALYDPVLVFRHAMSNMSPEEQLEYLNGFGFEYEEVPAVVTVPSGMVGLSGSIDIELTPPGAGSNPSFAILGSSILADGVLENQGYLGFFGSVLNQIEDAVFSIGTLGGSPAPGIELNNDGTFALTPHQFSLIGGISTLEGVGALASFVNDDPLNVPLDVSTAPFDLVQGGVGNSYHEIIPLSLNAILSGSSNLDGSHTVELYIPFSLAYNLKQVGLDELGGDTFNLISPATAFDGVIVATGTSSFAIPQSSLLVVPEPSTWLMAMIGAPLFAVAVLRNRKRASQNI